METADHGQQSDDYAELYDKLLESKKDNHKSKFVHRVADCALSDCESGSKSGEESSPGPESVIVELPERLAAFEELSPPIESAEFPSEYEVPQPAKLSKKAMKK